uniref:WD repeat-containing protein 90 n=1 Tax=Apteryx owenii TaxID=8824 RepID=A0A8B9Q1W1_APTOW
MMGHRGAGRDCGGPGRQNGARGSAVGLGGVSDTGGYRGRNRPGACRVPRAVSAVWQNPYLNVFKHFKVEEWKRSTKEGDVTTFMDKTLKGTVYRIRGSIPASNYIQLPKTSTQSLGLVGRYLYLLFRPMPNKYFVVHLDVTAEDNQVVRISFSNLFKEFKSTATWLQFPFISQPRLPNLVGAAPANVRWTCLMLDLHYILSMYLNRRYSHLKSVKLCSNLLVKNLCTSDLLFDPGVTFSEARQANLACHGMSPMPREMAFPVPKGEKWHDRYDYIRYTSQLYERAVLSPAHLQQISKSPACLRKLCRSSLGTGSPLWDLILPLILAFVLQALWTQNNSAVVYPCHAVIVTMQIQTGEQRFFVGHTDKVSALAFNGNSTLLASAQTGPLSVVRLWEFPKGNCLSVFKTHVRSLTSLSFSYSGAVLCGIGKDGHGKTMVMVWNTAQVTRGGEVVVLAKAHTDVDIQNLKIAFFDDTRMVSCGRDNVRLWRVRSGALRSCPVNLGEYHSLEFTDLAFEEGHSAERDFVCSKSGHILEMDYKNVCIRSARRLLPSQPSQQQAKQACSAGPGIAINSISVSSTFCATGSEDGYLRLWPLDFSAVILEAEHEAPVSSVCISPDSLKVLCTTTTGNLGYLDIQSRDYSTLMRSHTDSILAFSVEGIRKQMATVSQDNTIRVWDLVTMQQLYDFTAADEMPCAVAFHPTQQILACGFDSGMVRTFSLAASDLLVEHKQHRAAITGLTFSPDGNFMFSSCSQGTLALYNCVVQKSHVLRVLGNVVVRDAGSGPDALVLSEDSRLLAFVGPSKFIVTVMEACSLDELLKVDISIFDLDSTALDSAARICFAPVPQGQLLVSTSSNKILVLDAKSGRLVREVPSVHKLSCSSLSLSKDARYLLTAGDKVIKVWDYQIHPLSQVYIGHSEPVRHVAFTPDQEHVVSVGDAIFLWDFLALSAEGSPPAVYFLLCVAASRKETKGPKSQCSIRPDSYRHFTPRFKASVFSSPPAGSEVLKLKAVIGYNGNGRGNMVWNPDTGFFAYTCGCIIVVEDLHSGSQNHWLGHAEEVSTLAISHDAQVLASASGRRNGDTHCQICIWNIQDGVCTRHLFHHETQVQAMAYSRDDRFLITLGDYSDQTIALWDTYTYELMSSTHISEPVHDVAFNPLSHGELACVGRGAVTFWLLEQRGANINLKVHQAPVPDALGLVELTSLCYGADPLLYSGTNTGQICVWDTETNRCFMTWEADEGEIGVLVCRHNRLASGSNTKRIRLWAVAAVEELRLRGSDARSSSVLLEHEMTLDGTIVSAAFDDFLEMGIVGTTTGTLWYINWTESTSIRLISGHKNKVNEVSFSPDETHCATCGEDGSVRIWSLGSMELVVQFQVLNQSCQCLAWKPQPIGARGAESQHVVAGYSDGTIRVFSISRTEMELKMHPHAVALTAVAYSTDGEIILSGGKDGLVAVSSPRTGMTVRILADHKGSPITVIQCTGKQYYDFGVEGSELWLATSSDRRVSVWASDWLRDKCELLDWLSFPAPAVPEGLSSLPPSLAAFCPWEHGTLVYVGFGMQKEAVFYSLRKKQVVEKISLPYFAMSLSLSPAARFLAVGFGERLLRLLRGPAEPEQDYAGHDDAVHFCRFTPSGRRLFTASYNELLVWEATDHDPS